jgi:hypothetical protein
VAARESRLAESLIALADDLGTDEVSYRQRVVHHLAELVAPADVGLLSLSDSGHLTEITAQTWRMQHLLRIEARVHEGPCSSSHGSGRRVRADLDAADWRWPRFAPEARGAGFTSATALPMTHNDDSLGAVSILAMGLRTDRDPDIDMAAAFVEAATIGIVQRRAYRSAARRAAWLQDALDSRVLIEQAKGMLSAQVHTTPDVAYDIMHAYARDHGRRLQDVAEATIRGELDWSALGSRLGLAPSP